MTVPVMSRLGSLQLPRSFVTMHSLIFIGVFLCLNAFTDISSSAPEPLSSLWDVDDEPPLELSIEDLGRDEDYGILPHYPKISESLRRKMLEEQALAQETKHDKTNTAKV
uniref:Uncharacterized protein n=1 Tax=Pyxicephalus adspersus TaxID=30357 RepID=A0AAV2ZIV8_PYXAD|nr:TPA: hypothetical protein GDO54_002978 [Pyxicephalus adspersus]